MKTESGKASASKVFVRPFFTATTLALVLAGCGSGSGTPSAAPATPNPNIQFANTGGGGGGGTPGTGGVGSCAATAPGATLSVALLAGSPTAAFGLTNGMGPGALFNSPNGITSDGTNLYVADQVNNEIRQIGITSCVVTLLAGDPAGLSGTKDGAGTAAQFNNPIGITTDGTNLYVADTKNNMIRKIVIASGAVTTLAGNGGFGMTNNTNGLLATFNIPNGIATDGTNLYVTDFGNNQIRKVVIATGATSLYTGSPTGATGSTNGPLASATFSAPRAAIVTGGNLYVVDQGSNTIRQINLASGTVSLFAGDPAGKSGMANSATTGSAASFATPMGIGTDGTNLYVADWGNNQIRKVVIGTGTVSGAVSLYAGSPTGARGLTNGAATTAAQFYGPTSVVPVGTALYVADWGNQEIRVVY